MKKSIYNIYLVTDPKYSIDEITSAMDDGVTMVQLREKELSREEFINKAKLLKEECNKRDIPFIINDNIDVAIEVDADGIHIGQDDISIEECKTLFPNKIIGMSASTYEEAKSAEEDGATYIGLGAISKTETKNDAKLVAEEDLNSIIEDIKIPIILIGGINETNIDNFINKDIDGIAMVSSLLDNVEQRRKVISSYDSRK